MILYTDYMGKAYLLYEYVDGHRDHAYDWKFYGIHYMYEVDLRYASSYDQLDLIDF